MELFPKPTSPKKVVFSDQLEIRSIKMDKATHSLEIKDPESIGRGMIKIVDHPISKPVSNLNRQNDQSITWGWNWVILIAIVVLIILIIVGYLIWKYYWPNGDRRFFNWN